MQKLSKFLFVLMFVVSLHTTYYILLTTDVKAQVPEINLACSETDDPEFHSLRPYQAAPCGNAPVARFCSNKLVVFEDFDLSGEKECLKLRRKQTGTFDCSLNFPVGAHDLNITLDESDFPIMGNTEDEFDDATKMNEYASWYLSGVIDKNENREATDDQVVNFSGPLKKLLPSMIQDQQRINIIKTPLTPISVVEEDDGSTTEDRENHDQDVVGNLKLTDWYGDISFVRSVTNFVADLLQAVGIANATGGWNHAFPPLPWDDGTGTLDTSTNEWLPGKPFESQKFYQKAYNEWLGKSCLDLGVFGLQCLDNPLITNKYAELWHFVPLSNNSDKKGKNYLLTGDGPNYVPSAGTEITGQQHKSYMNAPLYFPHTEEVNGLSGLLNSIFQPNDFEEEGLGYPDDVEKMKIGTGPVPTPAPATLSPDKQGIISSDPYDYLQCSNVNVRVNKGDYLYPGNRAPEGTDSKELFVEDVEYTITQVKCEETYEPPTKFGCGQFDAEPCREVWTLVCNAQVGIEFKLGTKTPWVDEIFKNTVAGTGSTFRKIFPKIEKGAPVECIADIPTVTKVKYSNKNDYNEKPQKGTQSDVLVTNYPADGAGGTQLTFPHVGSVYEYFLNGIQTALRPKGYGSPIANGNCTPSTTVQCGKVPDTLPEPSGLCANGSISPRLGNLPQNLLDIVYAAAETYKVPPNLILGIMFGESRFNTNASGGYTTYDWTEENVDNWATCEEMPKCHSIPYVYNAAIAISEDNWGRIVNGTSTQKGIKEEIKKIAPDRDVSGCNLLDSIYGIAWLLRDNVDGGPFQIKSCFGVTLNTGLSTAKGCDWDNNDLITAIKVNESGWTNMCFTNKFSCRDGKGRSAVCETGGDTCEKIDNRYPQSPSFETSHMGCVFDVAKGN